MQKSILLVLSLLLITATTVFTQYNHKNLKIRRDASFAPGYDEAAQEAPEEYDMTYTHKNLRLYPIVANEVFMEEHKDLGKFTLLKDAIAEDKIAITETGARELADADTSDGSAANTNNEDNGELRDAGRVLQRAGLGEEQLVSQEQLFNDGGVDGTVNTLFAQNNSNDTIFIMAGEVVKGGKQDRVIAEDIVLAPHEQINLAAFCVEKSRWTTKDGNQGKFTGYYSMSSVDIRKAVTEDADQSIVWNTVDEHTSKNGADSDTKTYTNLENSEEYQQKLQGYLDKFQNAFQDDHKVVGVIAVSGAEVIGLDMFATHELFADSYENLIHSYVGHAITKGSPVKISNDDVFAYLDKLLKDEEAQDVEIEKNGTVYKYKSKKIHVAAYK